MSLSMSNLVNSSQGQKEKTGLHILRSILHSKTMSSHQNTRLKNIIKANLVFKPLNRTIQEYQSIIVIASE